MRANQIRTPNTEPRVRPRMTDTREHASQAHHYIDTHDRETLLSTVPTGEAVARRYYRAAVDLDCAQEIREHFAAVYEAEQNGP